MTTTTAKIPVTVSRSCVPGECVISVSVGSETYAGDYADTEAGRAQGLAESAQLAGVAVQDCFLTFAE